MAEKLEIETFNMDGACDSITDVITEGAVNGYTDEHLSHKVQCSTWCCKFQLNLFKM
jgi:hypothetical protein